MEEKITNRAEQIRSDETVAARGRTEHAHEVPRDPRSGPAGIGESGNTLHESAADAGDGCFRFELDAGRIRTIPKISQLARVSRPRDGVRNHSSLERCRSF